MSMSVAQFCFADFIVTQKCACACGQFAKKQSLVRAWSHHLFHHLVHLGMWLDLRGMDSWVALNIAERSVLVLSLMLSTME